MNRIYSFFMMAFLAFSASWAADVTFDFSSAEGIAAMGYDVPGQSAGTNLVQAGPVTVDGVTLSAADGATPTRIWNSQGSYTLRIYVDGSITFSVAEGSITALTVNAANSSNFDLLADVGDYAVAGTVGTWTGNAASVTLTHVGTKNAQVASIVVTTSTDGPGPDPEDPIDPDILKIDSLQQINDLEDGTAFQFTTDVYVNYQWNEFLWLMQLDQEGEAYAAHVYGDVGKQYPLGAVIPAGWTGVKNTYRGLVEIAEPAHFANAKNILDEDYYSAFDCTGYMNYVSDPDEGWVNYKVRFDGVHLGNISGSGMFTIYGKDINEDGTTTNASMTGFNKLGVEYPDIDPYELYDIEGMVSIFDNLVELFPISITADPGTRLWKVLHEGEDGSQYKLNDTLYVAAASRADDGMLVYVTDNVDQIYYDTYADWGYAEWLPWNPDWLALDCSGDEQLFNRLVGQEVLAPSTVRGILADRLTNPRLVLNSASSALDGADYPTLTVFEYDLSEDGITAMGNELARIDGYFFYKDGVPCLCSEQDSVIVKMDFCYAPEMEALLADKQGFVLGLLSIVHLDEPWDENLSMTMRRISATADDYYTNYTICPLEVVSIAAVDEVAVDRRDATVRYISPSGIVSTEPHDGINIVVTTRSDGSQTAVKRLKN